MKQTTKNKCTVAPAKHYICIPILFGMPGGVCIEAEISCFASSSGAVEEIRSGDFTDDLQNRQVSWFQIPSLRFEFNS